MQKYFIFFLAMLFILPLSAALITGVQVASYSSQIASPYFRPAYATIDGSGLDAINGYHTTAPDGYMWLSAYGDLAPKIVYDLGTYYNLENIRVWNYNEINPWLNRSAKNVDILVSQDNINFTNMGSFIFNKAPALGNIDFSQIFSVAVSHIRYIKLDIKSNYGDTGYTGLSEIQFYGASIPEPSTWILLLVSLWLSLFSLKRL